MLPALTPTRSALGGTAVIMSCACGASVGTAKLVALTGIGATSLVVHPLFLGVGAALIVGGLWRVARTSAFIGAAAFGVLAMAALLTPPMVMNKDLVPWNASQMVGGALYVVAAALLGYAFWRAFPSRNPTAAGTAIGGAALATGCSCCMVTGAVAGMAVTAGASSALVQSSPFLFWLGLAIVAVGLFRLGGVAAAIWVPVGGAVVKYAPKLLKLTDLWMVGGVDLQSVANFVIYAVGTGIILYGFAVAYRAVPVQVRGRTRLHQAGATAFGTLGGD